MVKPEKFDYLQLVYHFTVPLNTIFKERLDEEDFLRLISSNGLFILPRNFSKNSGKITSGFILFCREIGAQAFPKLHL